MPDQPAGSGVDFQLLKVAQIDGKLSKTCVILIGMPETLNVLQFPGPATSQRCVLCKNVQKKSHCEPTAHAQISKSKREKEKLFNALLTDQSF